MPQRYQRSVFINASFDHTHWDLFHAMVFTVLDCGFDPRCALETDDGSQVRIEKLFGIIEECRLGIHDTLELRGDNLIFNDFIYVAAAYLRELAARK